MDIFGEEFSQMFSIVDGVRNQALADGRMTELAKSSVARLPTLLIATGLTNHILSDMSKWSTVKLKVAEYTLDRIVRRTSAEGTE
jgi:hypothetical protein